MKIERIKMGNYIGHIPKKISYVCSDGIVETDVELVLGTSEYHKVKYKPTWVVEDGSRAIVNAKKNMGENAQITTIENTGTTNVKICDIENKAYGMGAFKVLVDDIYYVEMKSDVVLESLVNGGADNGLLSGEFIWAKHRNELKLIRKGSRFHQLFEEGSSGTTMEGLTREKLDIGGVYKNSKDSDYLYLGEYQTLVYKYEDDPNRNKYSGETKYINERFVKKSFMVFRELRGYHYTNNDPLTVDPEDHFDDTKTSWSDSSLVFRGGLPKFIKKVGQIDLSKIDIVQKIKDIGLANVRSYRSDDRLVLNYSHISCECLNISRGEPTVHPILSQFKLPIEKK